MKKRIYALILAVSFVFCCMVLPINAERVPTLTIESKKVKIGGEVEVALSIDGNPGIAGIVAELKYDKTAMTLVSMNAKADFGGTFVGDASQGSGFSWVSAADIKTDGVFATFKFRINDDATPGKYGIELEIGDGNTSNSAGDDVKFSVVNGSLSVIKFMPGDINDDEKVNVKDLVAFAQYLAKWDVKVNELALDVNCDGKVNVKDIVRLAQYLAGWDVSIGEPEWNGMTKLKGYESIDFGGRTFIIASRNDGQGYDTTPEVWVETITNDSYNDSVFERNKLMNELYNCTIEVDENGQNGYAADFASGGGKYIASTMQYGMPFTQPGYYNILSLDIDFTKSWWDQNYINDLSYDGKLYSIVGDFARKAMECTWVITFNKTVYENSGIQDDIYQLVRDKKWTMDKMLEMNQKALRDVNNDQKYDIGSAEDSDIIGFASSEFSYRAFFFGCGERYVTKNESGKFVNAINLGKGSEVVDKIITLANDYSYQTAGYMAYQNAFKANKVLFMGEVLNVINYLSDTEGLELGVVPFPLYDENQSRYYVHVNNHLPAYGIPTSFADTQIIADFWTLFAAHSKYTVREAFVNSCKYVWTSDEENGEMVDIILDSRVYDPGYNWNMADSFEGYLNTMVESGRNQYTTIVERASTGINDNISAYEQRVEALSGGGTGGGSSETTETTTEMVTTTLPMYTRFDFGTASKAVDDKKTSHEWLVENLTYNNEYIDIEFLDDSWKITAKQSYHNDAPLKAWTLCFDNDAAFLDFSEVLMPAWGTWNLYPYITNRVGVDGQWRGQHQYVKVRLRSNSVNNMIGFSWHTSTNSYSTTMTVSNMYLDGGIDNKTRTANENWLIGTYDIFLCQTLASNYGRKDRYPKGIQNDIDNGVAIKFSRVVECAGEGDVNLANNWNWQQGKEITGLRFNLLGAESKNLSAICDSRENIKSGDWVEIDYIVFGSTPEQLETYKSKSELTA